MYSNSQDTVDYRITKTFPIDFLEVWPYRPLLQQCQPLQNHNWRVVQHLAYMCQESILYRLHSHQDIYFNNHLIFTLKKNFSKISPRKGMQLLHKSMKYLWKLTGLSNVFFDYFCCENYSLIVKPPASLW